MPVVVETTYNIMLDASPPWRVASDLVKVVNGTTFVKLRPWDPTFCRLVAHNIVDLPKRVRPSLAQCDGFQSLLKLRNDSTPEFQDIENPSTTGSRLFGDSTSQKAKKKPKLPRMNAAKLQELRENPVLLEVAVPGVGEGPTLNITFIKPAHPCDEMCIRMDPDSLEHVVAFIRAGGLDLDGLTTKRQYGGGESGVWRNGSAGLIQKLAVHDMDDVEGDGGFRKKWKSCSKQVGSALTMDHPGLDDNIALPLGGASDA